MGNHLNQSLWLASRKTESNNQIIIITLFYGRCHFYLPAWVNCSRMLGQSDFVEPNRNVFTILHPILMFWVRCGALLWMLLWRCFYSRSRYKLITKALRLCLCVFSIGPEPWAWVRAQSFAPALFRPQQWRCKVGKRQVEHMAAVPVASNLARGSVPYRANFCSAVP